MIGPAGDGWRYRVPCAGWCGAVTVVTGAYVATGGWCVACGRAKHGATVVRGAPVRGAAWPGRLDPDRLNPPATPTGRIVESMELTGVDDPRLPPAAVALCARVGGRMLLSVARRSANPDTATWHRTDVWLSVQWRPAGRPPTVMAFWRNGQRHRAMIAGREMSHTEAGAL